MGEDPNKEAREVPESPPKRPIEIARERSEALRNEMNSEITGDGWQGKLVSDMDSRDDSPAPGGEAEASPEVHQEHPREVPDVDNSRFEWLLAQSPLGRDLHEESARRRALNTETEQESELERIKENLRAKISNIEASAHHGPIQIEESAAEYVQRLRAEAANLPSPIQSASQIYSTHSEAQQHQSVAPSSAVVRVDSTSAREYVNHIQQTVDADQAHKHFSSIHNGLGGSVAHSEIVIQGHRPANQREAAHDAQRNPFHQSRARVQQLTSDLKTELRPSYPPEPPAAPAKESAAPAPAPPAPAPAPEPAAAEQQPAPAAESEEYLLPSAADYVAEMKASVGVPSKPPPRDYDPFEQVNARLAEFQQNLSSEKETRSSSSRT